ncbi:hypothetical protein JCM13304A_21440 [Desulfothermus okinawensis JCM 13304]
MFIKYGEKFNPDKKSVIIFNHILKCGGNTFNRILVDHFGSTNDNDTFFFNVNNELCAIVLYKLRHFLKKKKLIILKGHCSWRSEEILEDYEDRNIYCITILRDPWDRLISHYYFASYRNYIKSDFESFLYSMGPNFYTNWLGNGNLGLAKKTLANSHYLFGLVERYDDFLKIFAYYFGKKKIIYQAKNVLRSFIDTDKNKDLVKYKDLFLKKNDKDIELYQWARDLFDERINKLNKKLQMMEIKKSNIEKTTKGLGGFFKYTVHDIAEKEELLKKDIQTNPLILNKLIYYFYREYGLWEKYVGAIDSLIEFFNKYLKELKLSEDSFVIKQINSFISEKEKILSHKRLDLREIYRHKINFDDFLSNLLETVLKDYQIKFKNEMHYKSFYCFCKNNKYKKVGFYGISSAFMLHFESIKKYLTNCRIFLFDSDKKKHGKKIDELTIYSPERIIDIQPELIIITSAFYEEIFNYLVELKTVNKLDFRIARLENHFFQYVDFLSKTEPIRCNVYKTLL